MISVNRNFGSLVGQLHLQAADNAVKTVVQRLSSGARINSTADDSAGMAVVSKMDSQNAGLSIAIKNNTYAISLFNSGWDIVQSQIELGKTTNFGWCRIKNDSAGSDAKARFD